MVPAGRESTEGCAGTGSGKRRAQQGAVCSLFSERGGAWRGNTESFHPLPLVLLLVCSGFVLSCPGTAVPMIMGSTTRLCSTGQGNGLGRCCPAKNGRAECVPSALCKSCVMWCCIFSTIALCTGRPGWGKVAGWEQGAAVGFFSTALVTS